MLTIALHSYEGELLPCWIQLVQAAQYSVAEQRTDDAVRRFEKVLSVTLVLLEPAGVDPEKYIEDVLGRLSTTKSSDIASLTPWAWAAARS